MLKIHVIEDDLKTSDPIKTAVMRQESLDVIVDCRYMIVRGNEKYPRRLPASAEQFQIDLALGNKDNLAPFTFEI